VLHRLSDKVTPYKEAVEEARQLCFLLQAPAVVWEYVPPGQNKWQSFTRDDIAKIDRWCQEGGEPNIEVQLDGHGKYIVDMEQLRMQKKNPGMGFQGGNAIQPVRRRDMGPRMTQLFEKAELTEVEARDLMAKLKQKMDRVTEEVTKHAEGPQEADCQEVGEVYTWPMCNVCTFMNEVTGTHCEMCQTAAPPAIVNPFADMSEKTWICDKCDCRNADNSTGCIYCGMLNPWLQGLGNAEYLGGNFSMSYQAGYGFGGKSGAGSKGIDKQKVFDTVVGSQGPFITRTITTTALRVELEELIGQLKRGEDVSCASPDRPLVVNPRYDTH